MAVVRLKTLFLGLNASLSLSWQGLCTSLIWFCLSKMESHHYCFSPYSRHWHLRSRALFHNHLFTRSKNIQCLLSIYYIPALSYAHHLPKLSLVNSRPRSLVSLVLSCLCEGKEKSVVLLTSSSLRLLWFSPAQGGLAQPTTELLLHEFSEVLRRHSFALNGIKYPST